MRHTKKSPDGGLWTGAKVAHWMSETLQRPVEDVPGGEEHCRLEFRPLRMRRRHQEANAQIQEGFQAGASRAVPV